MGHESLIIDKDMDRKTPVEESAGGVVFEAGEPRRRNSRVTRRLFRTSKEHEILTVVEDRKKLRLLADYNRQISALKRTLKYGIEVKPGHPKYPVRRFGNWRKSVRIPLSERQTERRSDELVTLKQKKSLITNSGDFRIKRLLHHEWLQQPKKRSLKDFARSWFH